MIRYHMPISKNHYNQFKSLCMDLKVKFYPSMCVDKIYVTCYFNDNETANEFNRRYYSYIDIKPSEFIANQNVFKRVMNHIKYYVNKMFHK